MLGQRIWGNKVQTHWDTSCGEKVQSSASPSVSQTSVNNSSPSRETPHKRKLWDSLVLSKTLTVENVTVEHSGEWTCTASSGRMEKSASAFLRVYGR